MNKLPSRHILSRRDFLKFLAAAGVTATGGYMLFECAPWLDYDQQADATRRPLEKGSPKPAHMRELVRYAALAAK